MYGVCGLDDVTFVGDVHGLAHHQRIDVSTPPLHAAKLPLPVSCAWISSVRWLVGLHGSSSVVADEL